MKAHRRVLRTLHTFHPQQATSAAPTTTPVDPYTTRNNQAIVPGKNTPEERFLYYENGREQPVLEGNGRAMLNPHHKAYKAFRNCCKTDRTWEWSQTPPAPRTGTFQVPRPQERHEQSSNPYRRPPDVGEQLRLSPWGRPLHHTRLGEGSNPLGSEHGTNPLIPLSGPRGYLRPHLRTVDTVNDSELNEVGKEYPSETEFRMVMNYLLLVLLKSLERASKRPPLPTTCHNDPPLLRKVATVILKVAELEKQSLLKILQMTAALRPSHPPPQRPANPAPHPAPPVRPSGISKHPPPPPPSTVPP